MNFLHPWRAARVICHLKGTPPSRFWESASIPCRSPTSSGKCVAGSDGLPSQYPCLAAHVRRAHEYETYGISGLDPVPIGSMGDRGNCPPIRGANAPSRTAAA